MVIADKPNITVKYNGETQSMTDVNGTPVYPLLNGGTTYLPIRAVSNMLVIDDSPVPYLTPDGVDAALERTEAWWQRQVGQSFRTGNTRFDAWMRWVAVQPVLRRICGCSFLPHHDYGRGGRGWRDLWQDSLALLLTNPSGVRKDLLS